MKRHIVVTAILLAMLWTALLLGYWFGYIYGDLPDELAFGKTVNWGVVSSLLVTGVAVLAYVFRKEEKGETKPDEPQEGRATTLFGPHASEGNAALAFMERVRIEYLVLASLVLIIPLLILIWVEKFAWLIPLLLTGAFIYWMGHKHKGHMVKAVLPIAIVVVLCIAGTVGIVAWQNADAIKLWSDGLLSNLTYTGPAAEPTPFETNIVVERTFSLEIATSGRDEIIEVRDNLVAPAMGLAFDAVELQNQAYQQALSQDVTSVKAPIDWNALLNGVNGKAGAEIGCETASDWYESHHTKSGNTYDEMLVEEGYGERVMAMAENNALTAEDAALLDETARRMTVGSGRGFSATDGLCWNLTHMYEALAEEDWDAARNHEAQVNLAVDLVNGNLARLGYNQGPLPRFVGLVDAQEGIANAVQVVNVTSTPQPQTVFEPEATLQATPVPTDAPIPTATATLVPTVDRCLQDPFPEWSYIGNLRDGADVNAFDTTWPTIVAPFGSLADVPTNGAVRIYVGNDNWTCQTGQIPVSVIGTGWFLVSTPPQVAGNSYYWLQNDGNGLKFFADGNGQKGAQVWPNVDPNCDTTNPEFAAHYDNTDEGWRILGSQGLRSQGYAIGTWYKCQDDTGLYRIDIADNVGDGLTPPKWILSPDVPTNIQQGQKFYVLSECYMIGAGCEQASPWED